MRTDRMMVLHACVLWVWILYDVLHGGVLKNLDRLLSWMLNTLMRMIVKVGDFTIYEIFIISWSKSCTVHFSELINKEEKF